MSRLYIRGPAPFSSGKVEKYANLYGSLSVCPQNKALVFVQDMINAVFTHWSF